MDKPLVIGELAKLKYYTDIVDTEIKKEVSDIVIVKENLEKVFETFMTVRRVVYSE